MPPIRVLAEAWGGRVELLTPAEQQQVPGPRVGPHAGTVWNKMK